MSERADLATIAWLEHELGIGGHEETCIRCNPRKRLPDRFSRGGVVTKATRRMQLTTAVAPARGGDLHLIYADECFLSEDSVCVRRDDIHQAARIKADRTWLCPLHD